MMKLGQIAHGYEPRTFAEHPKLISNNDMVGIEIELENCPLMNNSAIDELNLWYVTEDSSLRGDYPVELKFRYPLGGADIVYALEQLERVIESRNIKPDINMRTSLHVHMDVRDLDTQELLTLCAGYVSTEPLLLEFAGKHRKENIYCLPWYKAEHTLLMFDRVDKLLSEESVFMCSHGSHKYSALNMKALHDRGSIEFRFSEAHYHCDDILKYVNILLKLKKFARDNAANLFEVPKMVSGSSVKSFIDNIYGEYGDIMYYPGCESAVLRGARLAQRMLMGDKIAHAAEIIAFEWIGQDPPRMKAKASFWDTVGTTPFPSPTVGFGSNTVETIAGIDISEPAMLFDEEDYDEDDD